MAGKFSGVWVVASSFLVAFMLTVLPLPEWAVAWRPAWVALVLSYWCLALPQSVGVLTAWITGLLLDVLNGSFLGQHALGLSFIAYFIVLNHQQIRVFPLFRQAIVIGSVVFVYTLFVLAIYNFLGSKRYGYDYLFSAVTSALIWPWLFIVLRDLRRKSSLA